MVTLFKPLKPVTFFLFISLIAGIFAGNFFPEQIVAAKFVLIFAVSFFLTVVFWWIFRKKMPTKGLFFIIGLCLIFLSGFVCIQAKRFPRISDNHISHFTDAEKYRITGRVVSFAKHYDRKTKIVLSCQRLESDQDTIKTSGKINVTIYGKQGLLPQFGDVIQFESKIKSIRNFDNPGGFDYQRFLKFQSIFGSAWADIKKIQIKTGPDAINAYAQILRKIEKHRTAYYQFVSEYTKDLNGSHILVSLVAGKKEVLSAEIRDLFSKAGLSHLLAISGLHLSIVSLLFFSLFYWVLSLNSCALISGKSKKMAGALTLFPLAAYAVFTGCSASTQRALIMVTVVLISLASEKEKDILSSLSAAGIIILLADASALFSISFQLSFLAVGCIIAGLSIIRKYSFLYKNTLLSKTCMMVCITFFASFGTAPLIAHYFNMVSFIGLISNIIFIPLVGFFVLPLGLLSMLLFSFSPSFAEIIITLCTKLISLAISLCSKLVGIPFSWSRVPTPGWAETGLIYCLIAAIFLILMGRKKMFASLMIVAVIGGCAQFWHGHRSPTETPNLLITVLDVGQGSSALIQTPEQKNILVDGGGFSKFSSFDIGRFVVAPFLWAKRITHIDYVVLSHPEGDHIGGLVYILENFRVGVLIKNSDELSTEIYQRLFRVCKKNNVQIWNPSAEKNVLSFDQSRLVFVDASNSSFSNNLNNNSLVFKLVYGEFSMLFAGDILKSREERLYQMEHINLDADVLLSPHHGSATSSTKLFLDKVSPGSVIISCGWNNRYGFPHKKVLKRYGKIGADIFRTDEDGAVLITSNGNGHNILTRKGGHSCTIYTFPML